MRTVVALIVVCLPCFGQAGKAELFGAILDPTGLPIANAKVQAIEQATEAAFATTSNERSSAPPPPLMRVRSGAISPKIDRGTPRSESRTRLR